MMKILIVGGTGTIGRKITEQLKVDHEVVVAGSKSGDIQVDMTQKDSIKALLENTGKIDALIVTAGDTPVKPLNEIEESDFYKGIQSKMMGQINLALLARPYINSGGSITLTSGFLTRIPIPIGGTILSTVNGAVESFVISASQELFMENIRINAVSPGMAEDSVEEVGALCPGENPVSMQEITNGYIKSVKGLMTGQIIEVF